MKSRRFRDSRSRFITGFVALAATAALVTTNAQATTDLLIPPPGTDNSNFFDATSTSFAVFLLIPDCNASVTAATSQMSGPVSDYVVEFRSDTGGDPGPVVGSLAQDNSGASVVSYTGDVSVSAGVSYWVGVKATTGTHEGLAIRTGAQGSQWRWATSGVNLQGGTTVHGEVSWNPISNSANFPNLTLRGTCKSNASSAPSVERLVKLSLAQSLPPGVTCSTQVVEGTSDSWVQLPGAQDCTTSSTDGPTLLGWATQAGFPVQIAQRQVTNGWGAYESFDDSGALTGVFIPAGGFTVLSADTGLYPIWS